MFDFGFRSDGPSWLLLKLLIVADAAFVLLCIPQGFGLLHDEGLLLSHDRSYGEIYQYIKQLWIAQMLASLAVSRRCLFSTFFSALFLYFLVDDYMQLHEHLGEWFVGDNPERLIFGVQAVHLGELAVFAIYAIVVLGVIALFYPRDDQQQRKLAWDLIWLVAFVAFFAVIIDVFHGIAPQGRLEDALALFEDGGEMFAMSLIVWRLYLEIVRSLEPPMDADDTLS